MLSEKADLKGYFSKIGNEPILYCPNPGNAGDSAIALATYQLFEEVGCSYTIVNRYADLNTRGKIIVYGGGGNLGSPEYGEARQFIGQYHERAKRLIVLPHTVRGNEDLLQNLGKNIDIFCRERVSYDWVNEHVTAGNVYLADDMAFGLDAGMLLDRHGPSRRKLMRRIGSGVWLSLLNRTALRRSKDFDFHVNGRLGLTALYQLMGRTVFQEKVLSAVRTDAERTDQREPPGNVDVSRVFEYGVLPLSRAQEATVFLLAYLDQFERIVTNRLHIGILGALLHKEVDFYPNSYYKNKAVYEFSMRSRFPNVRWHND